MFFSSDAISECESRFHNTQFACQRTILTSVVFFVYVNDLTKNSMMILNMVSLLQNGGDYKDFYKSGKKEDFASYDEY